MNPSDVTIIIPSLNADGQKVLQELHKQSLKGWDYIIERGVSPVARARNLGANKSSREYLVFIDDDVKFNSFNVLEEVIALLKNINDKDAVNLTWRLTPQANWIQRKQAEKPLFTFNHSRHNVEMPWIECGGACFAIRSNWFKKLTGYDEELVSGEDCELAYRISKENGKIYTLPHCWVEHVPPATLRSAITKAFWYERGNAQVARKHPLANYRINLDRRWKAIIYLLLRSITLVPLIFFKVNYRQRWPQLAFRPFQAFLSYLGSCAYVREWLFPTREAHKL